MKTLVFLFAFLVSFFPSLAFTQEASIVLHGYSYHLNHNNSYNQNNYGMGIRVEQERLGVQIGSYNNSYSNQSNYFILDFNAISTIIQDIEIKAGPTIGVVTGYPDRDIIPVVGAQTVLIYDNFFIRGRIVPALRAGAVGTVEIGCTLYRW